MIPQSDAGIVAGIITTLLFVAFVVGLIVRRGRK
jgi:hypothetical protein